MGFNEKAELAVGVGAIETLVTDTICWEVVGVTASTISIKPLRRDPNNGVTDTASDEGAHGLRPVFHPAVKFDNHDDVKVRVLRRRKDGTYRTCEGARPLRFVTNPAFRTDYRF